MLEKGRTSEALTAKEMDIHQRGLVGVLRSLHDDLDPAVLAAYSWDDLANGPSTGTSTDLRRTGHSDRPELVEGHTETHTETLLERLTALNAQRAAEEAAGTVRWLRPSYQNPASLPVGTSALAINTQIHPQEIEIQPTHATPTAAAAPTAKTPWPATLPEQVAAVAAHFTGKGAWKKRLPQLLETLVALGRARLGAGGFVGE